jgi:hypothetical protein
VYEHDVLIRLGGKVEKRKKKLSKAVYGTSHTISLAEAKHVYQKGAARLLIGAGQHGTVALSQEAAAYLLRPEEVVVGRWWLRPFIVLEVGPSASGAGVVVGLTRPPWPPAAR